MEIRQTDKATPALSESDRQIVAAILKYGRLDKAAKALGMSQDELKAKSREYSIKSTLLVEIEQMLLLEHLPAALRYLLEVARGDTAGSKERVNVAKTILDRVGLSAKRARDSCDGNKPVEGMTEADLIAFIRANSVDVTPNSAPPNTQTPDWLD